MSEKELRCSRYIENFNSPNLIEKLVHKVCESVADAFLDHIEYGKDYVVKTELAKEDWADGFGTKCTYSLKFDELVRCRDCIYYVKDQDPIDPGWPMMCERTGDDMIEPYGFCAWGERREK